MSWICVGCGQVQATKDAFAPTPNHFHIIKEQPAPAVVEVPSVEKIRADVAAKMKADGATEKQIDAAVAAIK